MGRKGKLPLKLLHGRPEIAESISEVLAERRRSLDNVRDSVTSRPAETLAREKQNLLSRIRGFFQLT